MKRGISPLIATIILILILAVVASIVFIWTKSTADTQTSNAGTRINANSICNEVIPKLKYTPVCTLGPYLKIKTENNADKEIPELKFKVISENSEKTTNIGKITAYTTKEVYPLFPETPDELREIKVKPSVLVNNQTIECGEQRIIINPQEIDLCPSLLPNQGGELLDPTFNPANEGWDISLHSDAVKPYNWSSGYANGTTKNNLWDCKDNKPYLAGNINEYNPRQGHHAKWVLNQGYRNSVGILMNDSNEEYHKIYSDSCCIDQAGNPKSCGTNEISRSHRYMGISSQGYYPSSMFSDGGNITFSFYAKTDNPEKKVEYGIYYRNITGSWRFTRSNGKEYREVIGVANKWKIFYRTFIYNTSI